MFKPADRTIFSGEMSYSSVRHDDSDIYNFMLEHCRGAGNIILPMDVFFHNINAFKVEAKFLSLFDDLRLVDTVHLTRGTFLMIMEEKSEPNDKIVLRVNCWYREETKIKNVTYHLRFGGSSRLVEYCFKKLRRYEAKMRKTIDWFFSTANGTESMTMDLGRRQQVLPEYYPFIKDISKFLKNYKESTANILILLGEPGTGKTSFIKHFIYEYNMNPIMTHDQQVIASDSFYINYLRNSSSDLLILEDADLLMQSREHSGNRIMSKLLNAADGLVSTVNKKIIMTANLENRMKIDSAIYRPGRCFEVVDFRRLTYDETIAIKPEYAGMISPNSTYTLAEIFNNAVEKNKLEKTSHYKMGFAV